MVAALGKSELATSHHAGVGRIRERTIVIGTQVIAVDNIGTVQLVRGRRNWLLALLGLAIAIGAATQYQTYPMPAYAGAGAGVFLILINFLLRAERGLSIAACDGRSALIVSRDNAFLDRLLTVLTEKINTRNEALVGSFDIAENTINTSVAAFAEPAIARAEVGGVISGAVRPAPVAAPAAKEAGDEALFADAAAASPAIAPSPTAPALAAAPAPQRIEIPPGPPVQMRVAPPRAHDPLLDGPARDPEEGRDWLSAPGRISYGGSGRSEGGGGWVLPVLGLGLLGGGGFAAWMLMGQPGLPSLSLAAGPAPLDEPPASVAIETADQTMAATPPPAAAPSIATPASVIDLAPPASLGTPPVKPAAAPALAPSPEAAATEAAAQAAVVDFTPPETMVARTSGQRYRAQPSSADGVPILAETRAGGEVLEINGRSIQADGEWYRVALPQGRPAWFKASLAIPRTRFTDTFAGGPPAASFPASSPRILEPVEGAQISGGAQPVRLAWDSLQDANIYIVEIESFDTASQRWIDEPLHKRATIEAATELAETIPGAGAWRWRVRGVSPAGEQSQFSRWAAFTLRD